VERRIVTGKTHENAVYTVDH